MASTATDSLRLEKQGDGENDGTWGQKLNTALDLIDDAIAGMATVAVTGGAYSLTSNNYAVDEARCAIVKFTGTLASDSTITVPSKPKTYVIWNATDGAYTLALKTSGGTAVAVTQGKKTLIYCDGTDCYHITDYLSPRSVGRNITGKNNASNPNYQFDWDADEFVVQNSSGESRKLTAVDVTVDITASGANGLDTSTEQVSTWYYGHIIYNPTTDTVAGLLSTSWTSPTLPSGYTFSAPIGAVYNASDGHFRQQRQRGAVVYYNSENFVFSDGSATSETLVSVASLVPAVCTEYALRTYLFQASSAAATANFSWNIRVVSGEVLKSFLDYFIIQGGISGVGGHGGGTYVVPNVSQQFYYAIVLTNGTGVSLYVILDSFNLPIGGQ